MKCAVFNTTPWTLRVLPTRGGKNLLAKDVPPNAHVVVSDEGAELVITVACGAGRPDNASENFFCVEQGKKTTIVNRQHQQYRLEITALD